MAIDVAFGPADGGVATVVHGADWLARNLPSDRLSRDDAIGNWPHAAIANGSARSARSLAPAAFSRRFHAVQNKSKRLRIIIVLSIMKTAKQPALPSIATGDIIFVYGTLKTGYWNNQVMGKSKCLGAADSTKKLAMVDGPFPYIVNGGDEHAQGHTIRGELWNVDATSTGVNLDRLEGYPHHYTRKKGMFKLVDDGTDISAWFYYSARDHVGGENPEVFIREWRAKSHVWRLGSCC